MKLHIIISNYDSWKVKWENFNLPSDESCILIANKFSCTRIRQDTRKHFFSDIIEFHFKNDKSENYHGLEATLKNIIASRNYTTSQINLVTVNEDDILNCAKLRKYFDIPGDKEEDVERFINKISMKNHIKLFAPHLANHLPGFLKFENARYEMDGEAYLKECINKLGFRIFIKPTSECDSRGVRKINNFQELKIWADEKRNSKNEHEHEYELDEYIDGRLFHCDSIIRNGEIIFNMVSEYLHSGAAATLEGKWHGSMVIHETNEIKNRIADFNLEIIAALNPRGDCVMHHECFVTKENKIVFLEIAKRVGGSYITDMYSKMYDSKSGLLDIDYKLRLDIHLDEIKEKMMTYCAAIELPDTPFFIKLINDHIKSELSGLYIDKGPKNNLKILLSNDKFPELEDDFKNIRMYSEIFGKSNRRYNHPMFYSSKNKEDNLFSNCNTSENQRGTYARL